MKKDKFIQLMQHLNIATNELCDFMENTQTEDDEDDFVGAFESHCPFMGTYVELKQDVNLWYNSAVDEINQKKTKFIPK